MGFYSKRSKIFHDIDARRTDAMFLYSKCRELLWRSESVEADEPHREGRHCLKCKRIRDEKEQ